MSATQDNHRRQIITVESSRRVRSFPPGPLSLLVATAQLVPTEGEASPVAALAKRIEEMVKEAGGRVQVLEGADYDRLLDALGSRRFTAMLFLGQGVISPTRGCRLLLKKDLRPDGDPLEAEDLADLCTSTGLQLVLLAAPFSAGSVEDETSMACEVVKHTEVVQAVGFFGDPEQEAIRAYVEGFLAHLCASGDAATAFDLAADLASDALLGSLRGYCKPEAALEFTELTAAAPSDATESSSEPRTQPAREIEHDHEHEHDHDHDQHDHEHEPHGDLAREIEPASEPQPDEPHEASHSPEADAGAHAARDLQQEQDSALGTEAEVEVGRPTSAHGLLAEPGSAAASTDDVEGLPEIVDPPSSQPAHLESTPLPRSASSPRSGDRSQGVRWEGFSARPPISAEELAFAIRTIEESLFLPEGVAARAVMALSAGRDLLLVGPPRSGRASLARLLGECVLGSEPVLWDEGQPMAHGTAAGPLLVEEVQDLDLSSSMPGRSYARVLFTATLDTPMEALALAAVLPGQPQPLLLSDSAFSELERSLLVWKIASSEGLEAEKLDEVLEPLFTWAEVLREHGPLGIGLLVDIVRQTAYLLRCSTEPDLEPALFLSEVLCAEMGPVLVGWHSGDLLSLLRGLGEDPDEPLCVLAELVQEILEHRLEEE